MSGKFSRKISPFYETKNYVDINSVRNLSPMKKKSCSKHECLCVQWPVGEGGGALDLGFGGREGSRVCHYIGGPHKNLGGTLLRKGLEFVTIAKKSCSKHECL